jgi:hypothetical protein
LGEKNGLIKTDTLHVKREQAIDDVTHQACHLDVVDMGGFGPRYFPTLGIDHQDI